MLHKGASRKFSVNEKKSLQAREFEELNSLFGACCKACRAVFELVGRHDGNIAVSV
jgi:hypothetical protein